eukprot:GILK01005737.1.p1 GENE.GILK01005737.1~~GILK01005737.1.p1  ORF type:complete len:196 (+),score=36.72 GILK01005737.1:37-624(+)
MADVDFSRSGSMGMVRGPRASAIHAYGSTSFATNSIPTDVTGMEEVQLDIDHGAPSTENLTEATNTLSAEEKRLQKKERKERRRQKAIEMVLNGEGDVIRINGGKEEVRLRTRIDENGDEVQEVVVVKKKKKPKKPVVDSGAVSKPESRPAPIIAPSPPPSAAAPASTVSQPDAVSLKTRPGSKPVKKNACCSLQ